MDLKLLRTFIAAAQLENFHQTAERLYLTQPTVTTHIRQLEDALGFQLFDRLGKRVRLTAAGHRFLPHAQGVIECFERAVHEMTAWQQGFDTRLQVTASPLVATSVLPSILKAFTRDHPTVEVMVLTAVSPDIGQNVASAAAQVGLSRVPSIHPDTTSDVLYADPVLLIASPAQGSARNWHDLLSSQLLLTGNHPAYWDALMMSLSERQPHLRTLAVDRVDITKRMLEEGLGVSFLPRSSVVRELQDGRLISVPVDDMALPVAHTYLVLPYRRDLPAAAQAFVDLLRRTFPDGQVPPL